MPPNPIHLPPMRRIAPKQVRRARRATPAIAVDARVRVGGAWCDPGDPSARAAAAGGAATFGRPRKTGR